MRCDTTQGAPQNRCQPCRRGRPLNPFPDPPIVVCPRERVHAQRSKTKQVPARASAVTMPSRGAFSIEDPQSVHFARAYILCSVPCIHRRMASGGGGGCGDGDDDGGSVGGGPECVPTTRHAGGEVVHKGWFAERGKDRRRRRTSSLAQAERAGTSRGGLFGAGIQGNPERRRTRTRRQRRRSSHQDYIHHPNCQWLVLFSRASFPLAQCRLQVHAVLTKAGRPPPFPRSGIVDMSLGYTREFHAAASLNLHLQQLPLYHGCQELSPPPCKKLIEINK